MTWLVHALHDVPELEICRTGMTFVSGNCLIAGCCIVVILALPLSIFPLSRTCVWVIRKYFNIDRIHPSGVNGLAYYNNKLACWYWFNLIASVHALIM